MEKKNKYKVTDINNSTYVIPAEYIRIESINNVETYIGFYTETEIVALVNLSNIIAVVKLEID